MGQSQSLDSSRLQQSKSELLYQLVNNGGDLDAIKVLVTEGAHLEWIDREGKTPLIAACMSPGLLHVAKSLIDLGANINVYRAGRHAGTPLHHAAKRGLDETVKLLLSRGANALMINDDCQSPLDVARMRGHTSVVHTIENHICYFSGWLREFYGPGFLEALAPQLLSRKIWVVIIPCGSIKSMKPQKMELAIYPSLEDAQPRNVIALWKAKIGEPKFHQPDPTIMISDLSTKTRYRLASAIEGDKQQLQLVENACRGIPLVTPWRVLNGTQTSSTPSASSSQTAAEDLELAMAISSSIQSGREDGPLHLSSADQRNEAINTNGWGNPSTSNSGWGPAVGSTHSATSTHGWLDGEVNESYNGWGVPDSSPITTQEIIQPDESKFITPASFSHIPSAPPIPEDLLVGPIHYPQIDFDPLESIPEPEPPKNDTKDGDTTLSCVICWEAPIECACVPCGHMAGCMSCLKEIKSKKGVCPVCRSKIDKVIKLYAV